MRRDVLLRRFLETHRPGHRNNPLQAGCLPQLDRVVTGVERCTAFEGALPGRRQAHRMDGPQPVIVQLAVAPEAEDPRAGFTLADTEIETTAIVVSARSELGDLGRFEPT